MANSFGCAACFQGDAETVWRGDAFETVARLVDESHYSVIVDRCRHCGQWAVRLFTEFIDWNGGDDAMYSSVIPVTEAEARSLMEQGENLRDDAIEAMSAGRPYLQADHPTGKDERIRWMEGPVWIVRGH